MLKLNNAHFKHLLEQYQTVDEEIVRIETELEPASDARTEQLKRRRLQLKDELMALVLTVREVHRGLWAEWDGMGAGTNHSSTRRTEKCPE